jgi:hypothetical protein
MGRSDRLPSVRAEDRANWPNKHVAGEHEEIREWLAALNQKVEQNDADCDYEEKMLVEELGGHKAREEYALYPELDRLLTDQEKKGVFEAMAIVPER